MADAPPYTDSEPDRGDDADGAPDDGSTTGTPHRTPRWVKVFGIIVLALVLVFVILRLTGAVPDHGGGGH
ncbi:MAG: hypothetical protein ACRDZ1_14900 [Acidimicrobiia bacterium]